MWKIWCGSGTPVGDLEKSSSSSSDSGEAQVRLRWCLRIGIICSILTVSCMVLYNTSNPFELLPNSSFFSSLQHPPPADSSPPVKNETTLAKVLRGAAMEDKTVIVITLNEAWAAPNSMFDLFLESLRIGDQTQRLVNHLVVIALDEKAYNRCITSHPHCYFLTTEGIDFSHEAGFMTNIYLTMMWRRTNFLRTILEEGYNFVFSDTDIMWFRDPFPRFFPNVDFQIACDQFNGNPSDKNNWPNGGFKFVRSNNKTIEFYRFWNASRITYPGKNEQDILNKIKKNPYLTQIGLEMRFMSTDYFGGFCNPSKDFNLVCTMHANCCFGLDNKIKDLTAMLGDWKRYMALNATQKATQHMSWSVPKNCRRSHPP